MMEDSKQRLVSLSPRRQNQFQRILEHKKQLLDNLKGYERLAVEHAKSEILKFLVNEEKEKLMPRKHGSKGKKHRERGPKYIKGIEERLASNGVNFALLFSDHFITSLKKKYSSTGITYIGLCPFHEENSPSFTINPIKGFIKCFGCGRAYTAVTLFMRECKVTYPQALGMLDKYIYTSEEAKQLKEDNQDTMKYKAKTQDQIDKEAFVRSLGSFSGRNYLPPKAFATAFAKWKEEKNKFPNTPGDDESPF